MNRDVDKVERKARLANVHRQRQVEQRELRNLNRMGWQEIDEDDDLEQEGQWPSES
jgi:hypothetical protein